MARAYIYTKYSAFNLNTPMMQYKYFISSTDSDYLLNLCNKQVHRLTTSPAQPTAKSDGADRMK